jgi:acetyltransferase-like isoleucine patch superfamily enzyme
LIVHILKSIYFKTLNLLVEFIFLSKKNLFLGEKVKIHGMPIIQISKGAKVILNDNVTINSKNYGYHANMYSPVKLMADRKNAVIEIGENTRINGACIHAYKKVSIGRNCLIAANVQIIDADGHELSFDNIGNRINTSSKGKSIKIEENVWIGLNAIILPGVTIGTGSVIGSNTVVTKDVPPMVVFAGNPGRIVKKVILND